MGYTPLGVDYTSRQRRPVVDLTTLSSLTFLMSPLAFDISLAAISGLCLGSFLNVVAYRLPAGLSLVTPGSACPGCGTAIRPYDNVPVVSW